jgi:hypothetical protein
MDVKDMNNQISEEKFIEVCNSIIKEIESKIEKTFVHDPLLVMIECSFLGISFQTWEKWKNNDLLKKDLK